MARPDLDPADVAWSLATTRSVFEHRAVVTGAGRDELLAGLAALAAGSRLAGGDRRCRPAGGAGQGGVRVPGQGGQWAGMGRELAASSPVFAARLAECGRALAPFTGWALDDVLAGAGDGLDRVEVVQPALWAVMVSLAAVWQAAGVTPDAVVGSFTGRDRRGDGGGDPVAGGRGRVVALREPGAGGAGGAGRDGRGRSRGAGDRRSCCRACRAWRWRR